MSAALGISVEKLLIPKIWLLSFFLVSGNIGGNVVWNTEYMEKTKPCQEWALGGARRMDFTLVGREECQDL